MRFRRYVLWGSIDSGDRCLLSVLPQNIMPKASSAHVAELTPPLPLAVAEAFKERLGGEVDRVIGRSSKTTGPGLWVRHLRARQRKSSPVRVLLRLRRRLRSMVDESGVYDPFDAWSSGALLGRSMLQSGQTHRSLRGPMYVEPGTQPDTHSDTQSDARPDTESQQGEGVVDGALVSTPTEIKNHVLDVLTGRLLLTREIGQALTEQGVTILEDLDDLLAPWVEDRAIERVPAVRGSFEGASWRWQCTRCISTKVRLMTCQGCGWSACARCLSCDSLGVSTACSALYHRSCGRPGETRFVKIELPFTLTPAQQRLAQALAQSDRDALIWAACGSGKTEAVLETMRATLASGGRVLFALPRRDVVAELAERFQDALVGVETVSLSGDTPEKYATAPLIVSTVHQAVRFQHAFDLVVVDEVDAFPLNQEPWLLAALIRARRPSGRIVMMTATPPDALKSRIQLGRMESHTLPGRPHGQPLPVPEIVLDPAVRRDNVYRTQPRPAPTDNRLAFRSARGEVRGERHRNWVTVLAQVVEESVHRGRRSLVFVPSVRLCSTVYYGLTDDLRSESGSRNDHNRWRLDHVHAGDPERTQKIDAFSRGKLNVLISTSILERGITLAYLDVVVFMADAEKLFDAATLIQMAGRAGRRVEDPKGKVIFLAANRTPAMDEAISTIQRLNTMALHLNKDHRGYAR